MAQKNDSDITIHHFEHIFAAHYRQNIQPRQQISFRIPIKIEMQHKKHVWLTIPCKHAFGPFFHANRIKKCIFAWFHILKKHLKSTKKCFSKLFRRLHKVHTPYTRISITNEHFPCVCITFLNSFFIRWTKKKRESVSFAGECYMKW